MAKNKSQTRFVFKADGSLKRLISIHEKDGGGLVITNHISGLWNPAEGSKVVKNSRFSIHPSKQSDSGTNTIHCTDDYVDGSKFETHLVTQAIKNGRYQPILTKSVIRPNSLPSLNLPAQGKLITVPYFDPSVCTMHFSMWICSTEAVKMLTVEAPFQYITLEFKSFGFIFAFCYTYEPAQGLAQKISYVTTTEKMRTDEHRRLGNMVGPANGAQLAFFVDSMTREFNNLIKTPLGVNGLQKDSARLSSEEPVFKFEPLTSYSTKMF